MTPDLNTIIFLNRAYNDLDIQMPLIDAFAQDSRFRVRVITYPCDHELCVPGMHEAALWMMARRRVSFESLTNSPYAPFFLKTLHSLQSFATFGRKKTQSWATTTILKALNRFARQMIAWYLKTQSPAWMSRAASDWNASLIVVDEAFAQPGRSFVLDSVLPDLCKKSATCYMILTGHRVYRAENPTGSAPPPYRKTPARMFFVPNALNARIYKSLFPLETIRQIGNLRMDREWVEKGLPEALVPPFYTPRHSDTLPPAEKSLKIVVMLSKLSYGVDAQALKTTLSALGTMSGVTCAIKPHTRGMKFDFMPRADIGHAIVADDIPSTVLMSWADLVLFTGSSVVFHAALIGKRVGLLKYCQSLETIFDEGNGCLRYDSLEELLTDVRKRQTDAGSLLSDEKRKAALDWLREEIHNGDPLGRTAQACKNAILADNGINTAVFERKAI